jgi:hypothetical protein
MELGGYVARIYAHYHPFLVSAFVAQYFLIVVAPVLFSAAIYLTLTLVVRGFEGSDTILPVKPKTVSWVECWWLRLGAESCSRRSRLTPRRRLRDVRCDLQ